MKKEFILKLNQSDVQYGILVLKKNDLDLSSMAGKSIILKDSLGNTNAKVDTTQNRINGLTLWSRTRRAQCGDEISITFDDTELSEGTNVLHIKFLNPVDVSDVEDNESNCSFISERQLEDFVSNNVNINKLEPGLQLKERQYKIESNNIIDLLCIDKDRNYVVIELKNRKTSDVVVGQILRYIGCIKEEMKTDTVRGIIVAPEADANLEYAVKEISNVYVKYFKLKIEFSDPEIKIK